MNAERLLKLYGKVAEAPDAIEHLRRFVLDLAVRGKLVEQGPGDEPAAELLKRIAAEKVRLLKEGEVRNKPDLPPVETVDQPHPIPNTWRWVRFANIVDFSAGRTPSRNDSSFWNTGDFPWVSIADMEDGEIVESTKETVSEKARKVAFKSAPEPPGTMIMSFKLTIGKIARLGFPAFHNEAIISIRPHLAELDPYLFKVLPDLARSGKTKGAIKGATLNRESISNILIPLAPLAEQQRIVAKVDELMALLDRLETARTERETTRDRLTNASLARLTAPETDPEAFPRHAGFALDALPALTARPDQIKSVRQTILNLAVIGKLVDQDSTDEPASELLKRIAADKARLLKAGEIKRQKSLPAVEREPFAIPTTWQWVCLGELGITQTGSTPPKSRKDYYGSDIPFIRPGDLYPDHVEYSGQGLTRSGAEASGRLVPIGSILMVCIGTVGKCQIVDRLVSFNQQINTLTPFDGVASRFLLFSLQSSYFQEVAWAASARTTIAILNKGNWEKLPIPLPPLAEQQRIEQKVDELMALCDQLEVVLAGANTARARLLETLLHQALEARSPAREAA